MAVENGDDIRLIVKEEGRLFICACHCLALSTVVN